MDFRYPGDGVTVPDGVPNLENVNLILGNNGAGKTTALKAVALGLISQLPSTGFVASSFVRVEHEMQEDDVTTQADIDLYLRLDSKNKYENHIEATITRRRSTEELDSLNDIEDESFFDDKSPDYFMVAYGATRRTEAGDFEPSYRRKLRSARYERVAGLFEDHLAMLPFQPLMKKYAKSQAEKFVTLLHKLLPSHLKLVKFSDQDGIFLQDGIQIPFAALSDGYRAYIGWIMDLLHHMQTVVARGNRIEDLTGVVMLDEIDLHIHPSWQKIIIEQVARALPNLQFIFTTHSPIVAGSVSSQNLWIAKTAEDGSSILERPHAEIYGLSADQILTSDIFGLQSTRADGFLKELDELEQKAISGDEDAAIALMRGMALGKGAVEPKEPPAWVKQAAKNRKKS
jgi:predicted ATP-binding protein involved in virulence